MEILNSTYIERLTNPNVVFEPQSRAVRELVNVRFSLDGMEFPGKLGVGVLAFGRFPNKEELECLPWIIHPKFVDDTDILGSRHEFVIDEFNNFAELNQITTINGDTYFSRFSGDLWQVYFSPLNDNHIIVHADSYNSERSVPPIIECLKRFTSDSLHTVYASINTEEELESPKMFHNGVMYDSYRLRAIEAIPYVSKPDDLLGRAREVEEFRKYSEKYNLRPREAYVLALRASTNFREGIRMSYDDICLDIVSERE